MKSNPMSKNNCLVCFIFRLINKKYPVLDFRFKNRNGRKISDFPDNFNELFLLNL